MTDLLIEKEPQLRNPIAIVAFEGWNDAGSAASAAARFLTWRLGAERFATIDSEPFFDYQTSRPEVRVRAGGEREIRWPQNAFSYVQDDSEASDLVIFVGVEPSLRWRTFSEMFQELYRDLGVRFVISLGALLADVPHTRDPRVTGATHSPETAERLGLQRSRYEGPTGIVGVIHRALSDAGLETASLWANVPHYITTDRNPPATLALLRRLEVLLGRKLDLTELESASERFRGEVDQALAENQEAQEYVRQLEAAHDAGEDDEAPADLPSPEDVVLDIEKFLRGEDPQP